MSVVIGVLPIVIGVHIPLLLLLVGESASAVLFARRVEQFAALVGLHRAEAAVGHVASFGAHVGWQHGGEVRDGILSTGGLEFDTAIGIELELAHHQVKAELEAADVHEVNDFVLHLTEESFYAVGGAPADCSNGAEV